MILKKRVLFVWMQMKMAFQMIPKILIGTIGFAVLVGLIALTGTKVLEAQNANEESAPFRVGLVSLDDNKYTKLALDFLFEEDTVKESCTFIEMNEETALGALKKGKVSCVIVIPERFLVSILNGDNIPARIILPKGGTNSQSKYFREMVQSAANDLSIAQSAVYAIEDYCIATGMESAMSDAEDYINQTLLMYALRRNSYIVDEVVSVTGDFPVMTFYIASGIVLLMLFSGITCSEFLKNSGTSFVVCMKRQGIGSALQVVSKLVAIVAVYGIVFLGVYIGAAILGKVPFSLLGAVGILLLLLEAFAIAQCAFVVTNQRMSGSLLLFLGTIVMMFTSGCFLPDVYLPKALVSVGAYLPTKYMVQLCGQTLQNSILGRNLVICMGFTILFLVISCLVTAIRPGKEQ